MLRNSSKGCFAVLEAVFESDFEARLVYLAMKPDETSKVRGLRAVSSLRGCKIIFRVACRRGLTSLAYTLLEYLNYLKMIQEVSSRLEGAKYP